MDLHPSDDQFALLEMVTGFLSERFPSEIVRSFGLDVGMDRARWTQLAELGTFGLTVPEASGGAGLDFIEAVLLHEVLGAGLVTGPLIAATLAAGVVDGVLDGAVIPSIVDLVEPGPTFVENLRFSDILLMVADDGVLLVPSDEISGTEVAHPTDPTTPVTRIEGVPMGEQLGGSELARQWRLRGSLLASAQLCGNSSGSTQLAVAYVKEREQFGRPVGSFQGVKHLLADSWIRTELARSSVWSAGVTIDESHDDAVDRAVAGARLTAARAATENAKTCLQTHGGMGFTWEVDAHLFLKRAWVLESQFTTCDSAADLVADRFISL